MQMAQIFHSVGGGGGGRSNRHHRFTGDRLHLSTPLVRAPTPQLPSSMDSGANWHCHSLRLKLPLAMHIECMPTFDCHWQASSMAGAAQLSSSRASSNSSHGMCARAARAHMHDVKLDLITSRRRQVQILIMILMHELLVRIIFIMC